ncbi:hypothetical protein ES706_06753 [subsurface metagenome]
MSFNLQKAGEAAEDALIKGIIEMMLKGSPILQQLPFITIEGNTLTYWQEKEISGLVAWRAPGADWVDAKLPEYQELQATLKVLGGDMDFDNYTRRTRPRVEDYEAALVELKAKAMRYEFEDSFINGDPGVVPNQFTGLYKLLKGTVWEATTPYSLEDEVVPTEGKENGFRYVCTTAGTSGASEPAWPTTEGMTKVDSTVTWTTRYGSHLGSGTSGGTLSLTLLEQLIDLVKGGPPTMLLMSPRSRRKINTLCRAAGTTLVTTLGLFQEQIQVYNGVPIGTSDWVKDNYVVGGSLDCSVIFAFQMGDNAVAGVTTPDMIATERLGKLETKDAERIRMKWYVSLAVFSLPRACMLTGVRD